MTRHYKAVLLDIDNTLTTLQPTLDSMSDHFNLPRITEEEVTSFFLAECFAGVTHEEEREFWHSREAHNCKIAELAIERVKNIYDNYIAEDTEVHVITARKGHLLDITKEWLEASGLRYDSLHCVGRQSKLEWIEEHLPQVDAIFEDNPEIFIEGFNGAYDKIIDFYRIAYPYNEGVPAHYILDKDTGEEMTPVSIKED